MEWVSGNIFIRPNRAYKAGDLVQGHTHNFDHTSFFLRGWHLVRCAKADGTEVVQQFCSPEYAAYRALQQKHEPESIRRVFRMPDVVVDGMPSFSLVFALSGEPEPLGGDEITFDAKHYHALIKAMDIHEIAALSDGAEFACVFSHREPQGDVVQTVTGWNTAYR